MNRRLLPEKSEFEEHVRDRIIEQLEAGGQRVADVVKGDTKEQPFDWLLQMTDGTCIGLEAVRAEDEDQVRHVEWEHHAGAGVITGSAEMPWDSLQKAIEKKMAKAVGYRQSLDKLCDHGLLHFAVTSGLQQLHFEGEIGEHMEELARGTLRAFDAVWIVQGDRAVRIR